MSAQIDAKVISNLSDAQKQAVDMDIPLVGQFFDFDTTGFITKFDAEQKKFLAMNHGARIENLMRIGTRWWWTNDSKGVPSHFYLPKQNLPPVGAQPLIRKEMERLGKDVDATYKQRLRWGAMLTEALNLYNKTNPTLKMDTGADDLDLDPKSGGAGKSETPKVQSVPMSKSPSSSSGVKESSASKSKSDSNNDSKHKSTSAAAGMLSAWAPNLPSVVQASRNSAAFTTMRSDMRKAATDESSKMIVKRDAGAPKGKLELISELRKYERQASKQMAQSDEVDSKTQQKIDELRIELKIAYAEAEIEMRDDGKWYNKKSGEALKPAVFAPNQLELSCNEGIGGARRVVTKLVNVWFYVVKNRHGKDAPAVSIARDVFISAASSGKTRDSENGKNANYTYVVYQYNGNHLPVDVVELNLSNMCMLFPRVADPQARNVMNEVMCDVITLAYRFGKEMAYAQPLTEEASHRHQAAIEAASDTTSASGQLAEMLNRLNT